MSMKPLLRFAPSPTGSLHLGGLRTALFNHLFARKLEGKWILRIEDTDANRFVPSSVQSIRKALAWAGLHYDYGLGVGGPHGPYTQSERLDLYQHHARHLLEQGHAYRCFCSANQVAAMRDRLQRSGSQAGYDRTCTKLSEEEVARRVRAKEPHVIRLDLRRSQELPPFADLVFGNVRDAKASIPTDPVLLKSDGFPTYHLASVVDDYSMGITHVLRGEEWLPSLPLHRDLYQRLGWTPPQFGHLPLLLNLDGSKMSKRHGDVRVEDYQQGEWEPEALLASLALAGRTQAKEKEAAHSPSLPQLIESFDLSAYTNRRAVFDYEKLKGHNRQQIQQKLQSPEDAAEIIARAKACLDHGERGEEHSNFSEAYIERVFRALGDRLGGIGELPSVAGYFFNSDIIPLRKGYKLPNDLIVIDAMLSHLQTPEAFEDFAGSMHLVQKQLEVTPKQSIPPLRFALTGQAVGPSMVDIVSILGPDETRRRLMVASDHYKRAAAQVNTRPT